MKKQREGDPIEILGVTFFLLSAADILRYGKNMPEKTELQVSPNCYNRMCDEAFEMRNKFYTPYSGNPWNLSFQDYEIKINPKFEGYTFAFVNANPKAKQHHAS